MPAELPSAGAARRLAEAAAALAAGTGRARGLPGFAYADPEMWAIERQAIFSHGWVGIAYESDVSSPGDVFPVDFAGLRVLLTRGRDGLVRAFWNLCPHRGMPLVEESRTATPTITCPWHAWSFDLTGRLVATPHIGGVGVPNDACAEPVGLMPIACGTWLGVVFVDLSGKAGTLTEWMAPMAARLSAFDFSRTREGGGEVDHIYEGNWKLVIEGAVEDYHIPWVHKQVGPQGRYSAVAGGDRFIGVSSFRDIATARKRLPSPDGSIATPLPEFPHVPAEGDFEASLILTAVPSPVVAAQLAHVAVSLYLPLTPERTRVRRRFRFVDDGATAPEHAAGRERVRDAWQSVTEQDGWVHDAVQKSLASRESAGFRARFAPFWEGAVHHFQKIVAARCLGRGVDELGE